MSEPDGSPSGGSREQPVEGPVVLGPKGLNPPGAHPERNEASHPTPTLTLYCGICWEDRGVRQRLTQLRGHQELPKVYVWCPFCGEERHNGGTHLRVHEVQGRSDGEETILRIPHIIAA